MPRSNDTHLDEQWERIWCSIYLA